MSACILHWVCTNMVQLVSVHPKCTATTKWVATFSIRNRMCCTSMCGGMATALNAHMCAGEGAAHACMTKPIWRLNLLLSFWPLKVTAPVRFIALHHQATEYIEHFPTELQVRKCSSPNQVDCKMQVGQHFLTQGAQVVKSKTDAPVSPLCPRTNDTQQGGFATSAGTHQCKNFSWSTASRDAEQYLQHLDASARICTNSA